MARTNHNERMLKMVHGLAATIKEREARIAKLETVLRALCDTMEMYKISNFEAYSHARNVIAQTTK